MSEAFVKISVNVCILESVKSAKYSACASINAGTFVFMVHGLQGIIAIALIVLALLVVYHCVGRLIKGEPANKQATAA